MRMGLRVIFFVCLAWMASGCLDASSDSFFVFSSNYDFAESQHGWLGDFADYPEGDSIAFELAFDYGNLPVNLGEDRKALMLSGNNLNGDLFMFVKRRLSGFVPNTDYTLVFDLELASTAPTGSTGIDGYPGEGVYVKVGAVGTEPRKVLTAGSYVMNIDKGNQGTDGADMITVGNIAVSEFTNAYTIISRTNAQETIPFVVQSNSNGEIWLIVGVDSSYKGATTVYFTRLDMVFSSH
ncbi:MAG: hypothetical protein HC859_16945 [Bacteroidia bacterium]|nr:hypothetical protein [Bacteroidia bacterium]